MQKVYYVFKMELYLVRHGQTDFNLKKLIQGHKNNPLNEHGIKQAKMVAQYLKANNYYFDELLSSPLLRAYQTAEEIKREYQFKKDIILNEQFIERDFGKFEGLEVPLYINEISKDTFLDPTYEDNKKIRDRVYQAFLNLENVYKNKKVLLVCHSHTIKALLSSLDSHYNFTTYLTNVSIHHFSLENGIGKIVEFNRSILE